jgi:hypothetical protein
MHPILRPLLALALLLGSAVAAHAGSTVLYTAPTIMPGSGHLMLCYANNLDSKERELTVEIVNSGGTAVSTWSSMVQPGGIAATQTNNVFASYCRITYAGSRKKVRGAVTLGLNGLPYVPQVTLEAR